jgi:hypothetical protein
MNIVEIIWLDTMVARKKDKLPENFQSLAEAGDFWDTHSLSDYENQTKTVEMDFQINQRTRYITVPEKVYLKLAQRANGKHQTVRQMPFDFAK